MTLVGLHILIRVICQLQGSVWSLSKLNRFNCKHFTNNSNYFLYLVFLVWSSLSCLQQEIEPRRFFYPDMDSNVVKCSNLECSICSCDLCCQLFMYWYLYVFFGFKYQSHALSLYFQEYAAEYLFGRVLSFSYCIPCCLNVCDMSWMWSNSLCRKLHGQDSIESYTHKTSEFN